MTKNEKTLLIVGAIGVGLYALSKPGGLSNLFGGGNTGAGGGGPMNTAFSPGMSPAMTSAVNQGGSLLSTLFGGGGGGVSPGGVGSPASTGNLLTSAAYSPVSSPMSSPAATTAGTMI